MLAILVHIDLNGQLFLASDINLKLFIPEKPTLLMVLMKINSITFV